MPRRVMSLRIELQAIRFVCDDLNTHFRTGLIIDAELANAIKGILAWVTIGMTDIAAPEVEPPIITLTLSKKIRRLTAICAVRGSIPTS